MMIIMMRTMMSIIMRNMMRIIIRIMMRIMTKTSLLCRLQAQTLLDEAPSIGKIHLFSKIAVTVKPVMRFGCPLGI